MEKTKEIHITPMQAPVKILRITPDGTEIDSKKEIVFQFDRDIVPLGDIVRLQEDINIDIRALEKIKFPFLAKL